MKSTKNYRYQQFSSSALRLALLLLLLIAPLLSAAEGRCIRVSDGDTITIDAGGGKEKVRLIGIDAPELQQEGGREARQYLAKRILNRRVKVEGETRDRYGRLLGTVYLGAENINLSLVREGHAWDYKAYSAARPTPARSRPRARPAAVSGRRRMRWNPGTTARRSAAPPIPRTPPPPPRARRRPRRSTG